MTAKWLGAALGAGTVYAIPDVFFIPWFGFSGFLHSFVVGSAAAALLYSNAPRPLKILGLGTSFVVFCLPSFILDAIWLRWDAGVMSGDIAALIGFRSLVFVGGTLVVALTLLGSRHPNGPS